MAETHLFFYLAIMVIHFPIFYRDHIHGTKSNAGQCPTDVTKALVESMQYQVIL